MHMHMHAYPPMHLRSMCMPPCLPAHALTCVCHPPMHVHAFSPWILTYIHTISLCRTIAPSCQSSNARDSLQFESRKVYLLSPSFPSHLPPLPHTSLPLPHTSLPPLHLPPSFTPPSPLHQILSVHCDIKTLEGEKHELQLRLTFEDKMDRELTSEIKEGVYGWGIS